jgi:RNA polymerase sigma-70 factor (ECF subfamily)
MEPIAPSPARSNDAGADDHALFERIRAGDLSACTECIERYAPVVHRLALRLTGDAVEAEDVVQETFLVAFRAIRTFEGRSSLSTWLYRIATNIVMMRRRRSQPEFVSVDGLEAADDMAATSPALLDPCCLPERDLETAETRAELAQAIRDLPETLRVVFVLRELEGLSTEATAEALGLSPDVVKTRLYRARLRLRERLAPYFPEFMPRSPGLSR